MSSPPDRRFLSRAWRWLCAAFLVVPLGAAGVGALSLSIERLEHPAFAVHGVRIAFPATGEASIGLSQLRLGDRRWRNVRLDCARGGLAGSVLQCEQGRIRHAGARLPFRIDFALDLADRTGTLVLVGADGGRFELQLFDGGAVEARLSQFDLAVLQDWVPESAAWSPSGRFDGRARWKAEGALDVRGRLTAGAFGSVDGLRAAEEVVADLRIEAAPRGGGWHWTAHVDWQEGAAYLHPLYVEAGIQLDANGQLHGMQLEITKANVVLDGVEQLAASASIDLSRAVVERAAVALAGADLAVIGPRWLAPALAPAAAERLRFAGRVSGAMQFEEGRLSALDAVFDEAGFSMTGADAGSGVALGPVSGHLPWRQESTTRAVLRVDGGRWQKLVLGAFEVGAEIEDTRLRFDRVRLPLLDGALVVEGLELDYRTGSGWTGGGGLVVEPLSMRLLTDALDLPSMAGVLSASMPGLRVSPGEIALDGALVISVFDGYLQVTGLRLQEPFGVASHLNADIEVRHLDLAQLTETFSFGSISGFIDADILGLELVRWAPSRFDARVVSSPGRYPRRISQRAVQNISALGGAGAMAALQRSLLGFFDTFGYREIGFGCILRSAVCVMSGVDDGRADGGFVIVRGGGIPALDVIGYNRRVDWRELIERLQRVIADNVAPEVR